MRIPQTIRFMDVPSPNEERALVETRQWQQVATMCWTGVQLESLHLVSVVERWR